MDPLQRQTFLKYGNYRYLKAAGVLVALASVPYVALDFAGGAPYGGTWLGYVLGILATLLLFILVWYGVVKRRPQRVPDRRGSGAAAAPQRPDGGAPARKGERRRRRARDTWRYGGTRQGWLSAHVYLGVALLLLASLHAGFRFGLNVHTLPYVLMLLVVASGCYGVYAYLNYPRQITANMAADTLDGLVLKIAELD